ncbi:MAG TPA: hypothetical protein VLK88_14080 [Gemmatimonadales bacterium]|nr:hypothetical protein [Gemmatimonadales bacterium]
MPVSCRINHLRRIVLAAGHGTLNDQDVFAYQKTVWSRKDIAGYDELMDMTDVQKIVPPSAARIRQLAEVAAKMESSNSTSRFAILAPGDEAYGYGRMFKAFRAYQDGGTRNVEVFRTAEEALGFLGLAGVTWEQVIRESV